MTTLLIARHGNTFDKGDTLLRVGARTDLPLSISGQEQARRLGAYLQQAHPVINRVFTSELQRTRQTAEIALAEMGCHASVTALAQLNEIDYGPDEGRPEEEVVARLGAEALARWDAEAIVPEGWLVDPSAIQRGWRQLADGLPEGSVTFVVTSNGTARFSSCLLPDPAVFLSNHAIKLATGAVSCFVREHGQWRVAYWNRKP